MSHYGKFILDLFTKQQVSNIILVVILFATKKKGISCKIILRVDKIQMFKDHVSILQQ